MKQTPLPLFVALVLAPAALWENSAMAETTATDVGVRVGGYGFRETAQAQPMAETTTDWEACRMNGIGVFAQRDYSEHIFFEGGLDAYFTDTFPTGESRGNYQTPIDRVSGLLTIAAGARFFRDALVSPYVQLGIGGEITRVRLPELGMKDTAILPMGFFGVGADISLGTRVSVGASLRVNIMGYYDDAQFQSEMKAEAELATQGQFFAKFVL